MPAFCIKLLDPDNSDRGVGMFAARDILAYEIVAMEKPFFNKVFGALDNWPAEVLETDEYHRLVGEYMNRYEVAESTTGFTPQIGKELDVLMDRVMQHAVDLCFSAASRSVQRKWLSLYDPHREVHGPDEWVGIEHKTKNASVVFPNVVAHPRILLAKTIRKVDCNEGESEQRWVVRVTDSGDINCAGEAALQEVATSKLRTPLGCYQANVFSEGLFTVLTRANHRCDPESNCEFFTAHGEHTFALRAKKAIRKGEEITLSYSHEKNYMKRRMRLLKDYNFLCDCAVCVAEKNCGGSLRPPQDSVYFVGLKNSP